MTVLMMKNGTTAMPVDFYSYVFNSKTGLKDKGATPCYPVRNGSRAACSGQQAGAWRVKRRCLLVQKIPNRKQGGLRCLRHLVVAHRQVDDGYGFATRPGFGCQQLRGPGLRHLVLFAK